MEIERWNGEKEKRFYDSIEAMMKDAEKEAKNPQTKKLVLKFPKLIIPKKRKKPSR